VENCGEGVVTTIIEKLQDFAASFSCATYVPLAVEGSLDFIFVTKNCTVYLTNSRISTVDPMANSLYEIRRQGFSLLAAGFFSKGH